MIQHFSYFLLHHLCEPYFFTESYLKGTTHLNGILGKQAFLTLWYQKYIIKHTEDIAEDVSQAK